MTARICPDCHREVLGTQCAASETTGGCAFSTGSPSATFSGGSGEPSGTRYEAIRDNEVLWINVATDELHAAYDVARDGRDVDTAVMIAGEVFRRNGEVEQKLGLGGSGEAPAGLTEALQRYDESVTDEALQSFSMQSRANAISVARGRFIEEVRSALRGPVGQNDEGERSPFHCSTHGWVDRSREGRAMSALWARTGYRPVARLLHRFDLHHTVRIGPLEDGAVVHRCEWCGASRTEHSMESLRRKMAAPAPSSTGGRKGQRPGPVGGEAGQDDTD